MAVGEADSPFDDGPAVGEDGPLVTRERGGFAAGSEVSEVSEVSVVSVISIASVVSVVPVVPVGSVPALVGERTVGEEVLMPRW